MTTRRQRQVHSAKESNETSIPYSSPACSMRELNMEWPGARTYDVRTKRIYDGATRSDGYRVLVDRIWPRGVTKREAALDAWARTLAPSTPLRKWFGHDPKRWLMFRQRYRAELREQADALAALRQRAQQQRVTLLYAAKDRRFNHAAVLDEVIREA